jgi:hypothetical protein
VEVFAALPDGSRWGMGHDPADGRCQPALLCGRAGFRHDRTGRVSGTIEEMHEIEWPVCAVRGSDPTTRDLHGEEPVELIDGVAWWWWWCTRAAHAVPP